MAHTVSLTSHAKNWQWWANLNWDNIVRSGQYLRTKRFNCVTVRSD